MSEQVLGWIILGFLVVAVSVLPPYFASRRSYVGAFWDLFKEFNLLLWGLLIGAFALSGLIVWALHLIGLLR